MKLYLRKATENDVDILFKWANDDVVRKNSFCTDKIKYEDHLAWFDKLLKDSNQIQFILEQNEAGQINLIGQIRISLEENGTQAEIGYSVDSSYRGMGYGKQMLRMAATQLQRDYPKISRLIAKVKPNNVASYKAFIDTGFEEMFQQLELKLSCYNEERNEFSENSGGVLLLTNNKNSLALYERISQKEKVIIFSDPIDENDIERIKPKLVISYNYMHIVLKNVIDLLGNRIINMHISYLPWNRGANPNFWSFAENTPKGVTIHLLTEKLDQGDILFQKEVHMDSKKETFVSSYDKLHTEICNLLLDNWNAIVNGNQVPCKQTGVGSYHSISDFEQVYSKLNFSWTDNVGDVIRQYESLMENE